MAQLPEIRGASIVLRGHFTPAIFQPYWLASENLIRKTEAEAAEISLINPKGTAFSVGWLELQVLEDRFQVTTTQVPYFEALRDVAMGAFTVLDQTPVRALGINHSFHFPLGSEEKWHHVGNKFAPKDLWNTILEEPGMLSLNIRALRPDKNEGYIRVRVEPSTRIQHGLFIEVNDHFQLVSTEETPPGTKVLLSILNSHWEESSERGSKISAAIVETGVT